MGKRRKIMKKIISSAVLVGLVGILVISNATVEAAKKKENVVKESEEVFVVPIKEQENKKTDIKEKTKKETEALDEKDEKINNKEKEKVENNIRKEDEKEIRNKKENGLKKEVTGSSVDADGKVTKEDFVVIVNDVSIGLGTDINEVIEQLGEPDDYVQARSCLHDGDDKIYTYGGIIIYTYPQGKRDIVYIVEYTGEEKTPSGIGLGSTIEDLKEAYGNEYVDDGFYTTYELDTDATISFQLENQEVIYIEFYME